MIVSRTPCRISFFGGGTDYPEWFMKNGGAVLAVAIKQYCYVTVHKSGELWKFFDLPTKSGLGTSSAFTVGLMRATTDLEPKVIARLAVEWERDKSAGNVGYQDQYICALGGLLNLSFDEWGVNVKKLTNVGELEENIILVYTGIRSRGSYAVIEEQQSNIKQNAPVLRDIHTLVQEGIKALDNGLEFGLLLDKTWRLKKRLAEHISSPEIDSIYETAVKAGAIGGKLLGAGNGGFMVLYVEHDRQDSVRQALQLSCIPVKFDWEGTRVVLNDEVCDSQSQR